MQKNCGKSRACHWRKLWHRQDDGHRICPPGAKVGLVTAYPKLPPPFASADHPFASADQLNRSPNFKRKRTLMKLKPEIRTTKLFKLDD